MSDSDSETEERKARRREAARGKRVATNCSQRRPFSYEDYPDADARFESNIATRTFAPDPPTQDNRSRGQKERDRWQLEDAAEIGQILQGRPASSYYEDDRVVMGRQGEEQKERKRRGRFFSFSRRNDDDEKKKNRESLDTDMNSDSLHPVAVEVDRKKHFSFGFSRKTGSKPSKPSKKSKHKDVEVADTPKDPSSRIRWPGIKSRKSKPSQAPEPMPAPRKPSNPVPVLHSPIATRVPVQVEDERKKQGSRSSRIPQSAHIVIEDAGRPPIPHRSERRNYDPALTATGGKIFDGSYSSRSSPNPPRSTRQDPPQKAQAGDQTPPVPLFDPERAERRSRRHDSRRGRRHRHRDGSPDETDLNMLGPRRPLGLANPDPVRSTSRSESSTIRPDAKRISTESPLSPKASAHRSRKGGAPQLTRENSAAEAKRLSLEREKHNRRLSAKYPEPLSLASGTKTTAEQFVTSTPFPAGSREENAFHEARASVRSGHGPQGDDGVPLRHPSEYARGEGPAPRKFRESQGYPFSSDEEGSTEHSFPGLSTRLGIPSPHYYPSSDDIPPTVDRNLLNRRLELLDENRRGDQRVKRDISAEPVTNEDLRKAIADNMNLARKEPSRERRRELQKNINKMEGKRAVELLFWEREDQRTRLGYSPKIIFFDPIFPLDDDLRFYIDQTVDGCKDCGATFERMAQFVEKNWKKGLQLRQRAPWLADKRSRMSNMNFLRSSVIYKSRREERRKKLVELQEWFNDKEGTEVVLVSYRYHNTAEVLSPEDELGRNRDSIVSPDQTFPTICLTIPKSHLKSEFRGEGDRVIAVNADFENIANGSPQHKVQTEDLIRYIKKYWKPSRSRSGRPSLRPPEMKGRDEIWASKARGMMGRKRNKD